MTPSCTINFNASDVEADEDLDVGAGSPPPPDPLPDNFPEPDDWGDEPPSEWEATDEFPPPPLVPEPGALHRDED
jgi:hypothetical protein